MPTPLSRFRLLSEPREYEPTWFFGYRSPRITEARSGVLFTGLTVERLKPLLDGQIAPIEVLGAVGRKLFFARDDGPWIPYDREIVDQNFDKRVRERAWPWSLGDEVWAVVSFMGIISALYFQDDESVALYLAGTRISSGMVIAAVEDWAREEAGAFAERIDPALFTIGDDAPRKHRAQ